MTGTLIKEYGSFSIKDEEGKIHSISKEEKTITLNEGDTVVFKLINEYPECCEAFCDGDETCMICYVNNVVAEIIAFEV